jgi:hypothetical protein
MTANPEHDRIRREEVWFRPGDPTRGTSEFVAQIREGRNFITVIPCTQGCCPTLIAELRQAYQAAANANPDLYRRVGIPFEADIQLLVRRDQTRCYIAHLPAESKPELNFNELWQSNAEITLENPAAERRFVVLGKGKAGAASCALVIKGKTAIMIDCGLSIGLLPDRNGRAAREQSQDPEQDLTEQSIREVEDRQRLRQLGRSEEHTSELQSLS